MFYGTILKCKVVGKVVLWRLLVKLMAAGSDDLQCRCSSLKLISNENAKRVTYSI